MVTGRDGSGPAGGRQHGKTNGTVKASDKRMITFSSQHKRYINNELTTPHIRAESVQEDSKVKLEVLKVQTTKTRGGWFERESSQVRSIMSPEEDPGSDFTDFFAFFRAIRSCIRLSSSCVLAHIRSM